MNHFFLDGLPPIIPSALLNICLETILEASLKQEIHAARDSLVLKQLMKRKCFTQCSSDPGKSLPQNAIKVRNFVKLKRKSNRLP